MKLQIEEKDILIHQIYKEYKNKQTESGEDTVQVVRKALLKQGITFSRIDFKESRDALLKQHTGYVIESHDGKIDNPEVPDGRPDPNKYNIKTLTNEQVETHFCRQLYWINRKKEQGYIDPAIGRIIDYDVPVDSNNLLGLGTIDLITETADHIYLVQAKRKGSKEPLHAAVFEAVTYFNMISRTRMLNEYANAKTNPLIFRHHSHDITPAIMFFENSQQHADLLNLSPNTFLGRLILKYKIRFFILEEHDHYEEYQLIE